MRHLRRRACLALSLCLFTVGCATTRDPLPSWNEGPPKKALLELVAAVTDPASKDYLSPQERIAVFDNDGTLWVEQPMYTQVQFAVDRVAAIAPEHPEWKTTEPFSWVVAGERDELFKSGERDLLTVVLAAQGGASTLEFEGVADNWLVNTEHPRFERPYTQLTYLPMQEVLTWLRSEGFDTWIVSGGDVEFMRAFTEETYGIPPEQVIGSSLVTEYDFDDGDPKIVMQPKFFFVDDGNGKPLAIDRIIGRRPVIAFGNSDGDQQMLQWTSAGNGPRLGMIVHHDDAVREYAYDRKSHVGKLDKALDQAPSEGWVVISMKDEWKRIFAWESPPKQP